MEAAESVFAAVGTAGQGVEILQNEYQQSQDMTWAKECCIMDAQSMLLDALDHSKEEIRAHYDTYMNRIDNLIFLLAFIWPFALNTIQFSDDFVPGLHHGPHYDCLVTQCEEDIYPSLVWIWTMLVGMILVFPFWGILMLVRCKAKLNGWLERSLSAVTRQRHEIINVRRKSKGTIAEYDTREMVESMVEVIMTYQEYLSRIWATECSRLVRFATNLLWMSAVGGLLTTTVSMLVFFDDKGPVYRHAARFFSAWVAIGCVVPILYVAYRRFFAHPVRPPASIKRKKSFEQVLNDDSPLSSPSAHHVGSHDEDMETPLLSGSERSLY